MILQTQMQNFGYNLKTWFSFDNIKVFKIFMLRGLTKIEAWAGYTFSAKLSFITFYSLDYGTYPPLNVSRWQNFRRSIFQNISSLNQTWKRHFTKLAVSKFRKPLEFIVVVSLLHSEKFSFCNDCAWQNVWMEAFSELKVKSLCGAEINFFSHIDAAGSKTILMHSTTCQWL